MSGRANSSRPTDLIARRPCCRRRHVAGLGFGG